MVRELAPCAYPDKHAHTYWRLTAKWANPRWTCGRCHPPVALQMVCFIDTRAEGYWHFGERVEIEVGGWESPTAPNPTVRAVSDAETAATIARWRSDLEGWRKARVVQIARLQGEYHASMDNMNGSAPTSTLAKAGLLEKLNAAGDVEKRGSSYVWRLSARGRVLAIQLRRVLGDTDRLPGPRPGGDA